MAKGAPGQRELFWLCASVVAMFVAQSMSRPFVALYTSALGGSKATVGIVVAAFAFLPFFFAVSAGALSDRVGARRLMVLGNLGGALTSAIALWPSLAALIISQIGAGLAQLVVVVAAQAFTGSLPGSRERNYGWFTTSASAGQLVGPLLGGLLADVAGRWGSGAAFPYQVLFAATVLTGLVTTLVSTQLPRAQHATAAKNAAAATPSARRQAIGTFLRSPIMQAAMLVSFSVLFTMGARQAFFPLYLQQIGLSATAIGSLLSLRALVSMAIRPFMANLTRHFTRFWTMWSAMVASAVGIAFIPVAVGYAPLAVLAGLSGIGVGLSQPLSMIAVSEMSRDEERGLAMGIRLTGNRFAQLTNPLVFGFVAEITNISTAFWIAGILLALAAATVLRWREPLLAQETHTKTRPA